MAQQSLFVRAVNKQLDHDPRARDPNMPSSLTEVPPGEFTGAAAQMWSQR
jgi:hypothetical protein